MIHCPYCDVILTIHETFGGFSLSHIAVVVCDGCNEISLTDGVDSRKLYDGEMALIQNGPNGSIVAQLQIRNARRRKAKAATAN